MCKEAGGTKFTIRVCEYIYHFSSDPSISRNMAVGALTSAVAIYSATLQIRHYGRVGVSNHQPHDCLLNRLFRYRSNQTSKRVITGLCEGNSPVTGEFPHKGPVMRRMFPFNDVIMKHVIDCGIMGLFVFDIELCSAVSVGLSANNRWTHLPKIS